jgi:transposase
MLTTDRQAPTAIRVDLGAIFISLELSRKTWLVTSLSPGAGEKMSRRQVEGGELAALSALLEELKRQARARTGQDYRIICIQEAGYDGFWLHRELEALGVESYVVDPASVAVDRRKRRAKTDSIDGAALLRTLMAFLRGEPGVCSMARPPSPDEEDRRRPCRERQVLLRERIEHTNRIRGLLFSQGVRDYNPMLKSRRKALETLITGDGHPLPAHMKRQILRELDRLELVLEHLAQVEADRDALLAPSPQAQSPQAEPSGAADGEPSPGSKPRPAPGASLIQLKGIAEERAAVLGAYSGLTGSPFKSGKIDQEQGLSKSGNKRLRHTMIELAWSWLQHQPDSELSAWFHRRLGPTPDRRRKKVLIAALARKLLIALWRFDTQGVIPQGAVFKAA